MQPDSVLFIALGVCIVVSLATLVMAFGAMREGRRVSETLKGKLSQAEHDLRRAQWAEMDSQKELRKLTEQLEEQRPDRLFGKLEQLQPRRASLYSGPIGVLDLLGRGELPRRTIGRATCMCPGMIGVRGTTSKGQVCWPSVVSR